MAFFVVSCYVLKINVIFEPMKSIIGLMVLLFSFCFMSTGMATVTSLPESNTTLQMPSVHVQESICIVATENVAQGVTQEFIRYGMVGDNPTALFSWTDSYVLTKGNYIKNITTLHANIPIDKARDKLSYISF